MSEYLKATKLYPDLGFAIKMNMKYLIEIGKRFLIFNIFFWTLIGVSIPLMVGGPAEYRYYDNDWDDFSYVPDYNNSSWNILFDAHSHTKYSDGHLTPRQNILWHIAMGFTAMALTDHNNFKGIEEIRQIARTEFNDSIKVLAGVEWTTDRCHINLIFPPNASIAECDAIIPSRSYTFTPTDIEIQQVIDSTHDLGGIVIVNHYMWTEKQTDELPTRQQFLQWGVDYIESANHEDYDSVSNQFCIDNGLGLIATTDMHHPEPVYGWTTLNASEFTEEAIFNELKARRTDFIYDFAGSPYDVEHKRNRAYTIVFPLIEFGEIFKGLYSSGYFATQLAVFLMYFYGAFILFEVFRFILPKIRNKIKALKTEKTQ